MSRDKQLLGVSPEAVERKRGLDQALNAKEFAVLAGISYSTARSWFKTPGFPVIGNVVFWSDFLQWRRARSEPHDLSGRSECNSSPPSTTQAPQRWTGRAEKILREFS